MYTVYSANIRQYAEVVTCKGSTTSHGQIVIVLSFLTLISVEK